MTKIKKILIAIGAGLAAAFEGFMLLFYFEREKDEWKNVKKDLEDANKSKDAAIASAKVFQEEQKKHEEVKRQMYTNVGSDTSVNAAIDLMHDNQNRSKARRSAGV